ncbi:MAG: AAA family ATPase [Gammaproteobacteria bacterium]|nr:AAA family ATPase [Gammaproteobacteria bacterium]
MYVTTFYSFKGGVGRTMALVNSGVELAKRGRKVLLVDFDLEAPGLDTFEAVKPKKTAPGIVDFVRNYLDSGQAPEVDGYLQKCPDIGDDGGELWLMPAGTRKAAYAENFRGIDWGDLYERRDGFLLFEDLKAQWKSTVQPDHVFVDSRTGHTDVGGICTRQLPDAVAILFFPNEQNLTGLTKVVADIRSESEESIGKQIQLHFIMSNVPDLDDEDRILERKIKAFQKKLGFKRDPLVVHRYDSLSLLNQVVFTKDRPRSRLAGEYRRIVKEIVRHNLGDREGALDYLKKAERVAGLRSREFETSQETDRKLSEIEKLHESDGEILFRLGILKQEQWESKPAAALFGRAIEQGYAKPQVHLRRARVLSDSGQLSEARKEALRALESEKLPLRSIKQALRLTDPDDSSRVAGSPAVVSLGTRERIGLACDAFFEDPKMRAAALLILESATADTHHEVVTDANRIELALVYIAARKFKEAADLLSRKRVENVDIHTAFNFAMASWGLRGSASSEEFAKVIEFHEAEDESSRLIGANYFQCIGLAYWAVGDTKQAMEYAKLALKSIDPNEQLFTCWRYSIVSEDAFKEDTKEMIELFSGNVLMMPRFISK